MEKKISNKKILDRIVLEFGDEIAVVDRDTNTEIPDLTKKKFLFSCPYGVNNNRVIYLTGNWGRTFWETGTRHTEQLAIAMTPERAERHLRSYLKYKGINGKIIASEIKTAVYKKPQQTPDNSDPLNAFVVKGFLYTMNTKL